MESNIGKMGGQHHLASLCPQNRVHLHFIMPEIFKDSKVAQGQEHDIVMHFQSYLDVCTKDRKKVPSDDQI